MDYLLNGCCRLRCWLWAKMTLGVFPSVLFGIVGICLGFGFEG
jgi:hypothetical protein